MATAELGNAAQWLRTKDPDVLASVEAELAEFAAGRRYLAMKLTELTSVYIILTDLERFAPLSPAGRKTVHQLGIDVSGEAWKIANPASPHLDDPAYAARRDR
jgi:hypothetical protein